MGRAHDRAAPAGATHERAMVMLSGLPSDLHFHRVPPRTEDVTGLAGRPVLSRMRAPSAVWEVRKSSGVTLVAHANTGDSDRSGGQHSRVGPPPSLVSISTLTTCPPLLLQYRAPDHQTAYGISRDGRRAVRSAGVRRRHRLTTPERANSPRGRLCSMRLIGGLDGLPATGLQSNH